MPEARKKNLFKTLAGAVLAAALVVAPLVTTGAVAAPPAKGEVELIGEVGELVPWSNETNKTSYWEKQYAAFDATCYKVDGPYSSAHGTISADKKTITLKPFQDSWPGDHWALLVIKAGSLWNNVVELPEAGVAYASPSNGNNQAEVSHWIVCKGTTPEQPPVEVVPTFDYSPPTCDAEGSISRSDNARWEWADNGDGTVTWTALPEAGTVFPAGDYSWDVLKDLSKLDAGSEACRGPQPEDKVTYEETKRYSCVDSIVIVTKVTTTIRSEWNGEAWVELAPEKTTIDESRPMTEDEKADAAGKDCSLPIEKVERGAWEDGAWECGDTTVEQTRTVTTTIYSFGPDDVIVEDTETDTETQTRDLTQGEIGECPLLPGDIRSVCQGDVPYFAYDVTLPEGFDGGENPLVTITFVNPGGADYVVSGQPLTGSLLWPGASAGEPRMWPGWELVGDEYVPTDGNFAWTRGTAENPLVVRFDVNPTLTTEVVYPEATALCANPLVGGPGEEVPGEETPGTEEPTPGEETPGEEEPTETPTTGTPAGTDSEALAVTGGGVSPLVAVGGAAALAAGIAVVLIAAYRRRRTGTM